jgi:hypothetical protein
MSCDRPFPINISNNAFSFVNDAIAYSIFSALCQTFAGQTDQFQNKNAGFADICTDTSMGKKETL